MVSVSLKVTLLELLVILKCCCTPPQKSKSKEEGEDQELIQSSITPYPKVIETQGSITHKRAISTKT